MKRKPARPARPVAPKQLAAVTGGHGLGIFKLDADQLATVTGGGGGASGGEQKPYYG
jgi:hypothetical protein